MEIRRSDGEGSVYLHLRGDLVKKSVPALKDAFLELAGERTNLVVDLTEVAYIDSSGLGTLLFMHKTCARQGRGMYLRNLSPMVKKFFRTTGLLSRFRCFEAPPPPETEKTL